MKQLTAITDPQILRCIIRLLQLENSILRRELKREGCEEPEPDHSRQLPLDTEA